MSSLRLAKIEIVVNGECDYSTNESQEGNVIICVDSSGRAGHAQRAKSAMGRSEGNKNQRADVEPLSGNSFLEACRYPFIRVPVANMERLLGGVGLPRWSLFNGYIRIGRHEGLLSAHHRPFDFRGVLLVDNDVEL